MNDKMVELARNQLCYAREFERAAKKVIDCAPRRPLELIPVLHLIAHSFELTMKAGLSYQGVDTREQRKLNHSLKDIWKRSELSDFRALAECYSVDCCREAQESGDFGGPFPEEPYKEFIEHLWFLSDLHSRESDFALRYPQQDQNRMDVVRPYPLRCILDKLINRLGTKFSATDT